MGFMDKAKQMAEQAQQKIDEAQKKFNESQQQRTDQASQGPAVEDDKHGQARPRRGEQPHLAEPLDDVKEHRRQEERQRQEVGDDVPKEYW